MSNLYRDNYTKGSAVLERADELPLPSILDKVTEITPTNRHFDINFADAMLYLRSVKMQFPESYATGFDDLIGMLEACHASRHGEPRKLLMRMLNRNAYPEQLTSNK